MFCIQCGAKLPAGAKFCGSCGKAVEAGEAIHAPTPDDAFVGVQPTTAPAYAHDTPAMPWLAGERAQPSAVSSTPRPWLRYWAKVVDIWFWAMVVALILGAMFPGWATEISESVLGLILLAFTVPVNALLMSVFGNTIGKALLGIKVTHGGGKLTFSQALTREALVYVKGLGLGIPLVALFTQINAYNHLKREGASSWDKDAGHQVTHRNPNALAVVGAISIVLLMLFFIVIGSTNQGY